MWTIFFLVQQYRHLYRVLMISLEYLLYNADHFSQLFQVYILRLKIQKCNICKIIAIDATSPRLKGMLLHCSVFKWKIFHIWKDLSECNLHIYKIIISRHVKSPWNSLLKLFCKNQLNEGGQKGKFDIPWFPVVWISSNLDNNSRKSPSIMLGWEESLKRLTRKKAFQTTGLRCYHCLFSSSKG